jgi:hypothetical protein
VTVGIPSPEGRILRRIRDSEGEHKNKISSQDLQSAFLSLSRLTVVLQFTHLVTLSLGEEDFVEVSGGVGPAGAISGKCRGWPSITVAGMDTVFERECVREAGADATLFLAAAASATRSLVLADLAFGATGTGPFDFLLARPTLDFGACGALAFGANLVAGFFDPSLLVVEESRDS